MLGVLAVGISCRSELPAVAPPPPAQVPPAPGAEYFGEPHSAADISAAPRVGTCQLLAHTRGHDGELVRVHAQYVYGFEASILGEEACPSTQVWVSLDEASIKRLSSVSAYKAFEDALAPARHSTQGTLRTVTVNVTVVGRIDGPKHEHPIGYGHMGCCETLLTVYAVEHVEEQ
jgi:hypothetical protein